MEPINLIENLKASLLSELKYDVNRYFESQCIPLDIRVHTLGPKTIEEKTPYQIMEMQNTHIHILFQSLNYLVERITDFDKNQFLYKTYVDATPEYNQLRSYLEKRLDRLDDRVAWLESQMKHFHTMVDKSINDLNQDHEKLSTLKQNIMSAQLFLEHELEQLKSTIKQEKII